MTKIRVTLFESHSHVIELPNPSFLRIRNGKSEILQHVYGEKSPNIDTITFFDGEFFSMIMGGEFLSDHAIGDPIESSQYFIALSKAFDAVKEEVTYIESVIESERMPEPFMTEEEQRAEDEFYRKMESAG